MADHLFEMHETAGAYRAASHWWRSLVGGVDDHQWDQAALGEWSVRELVAHTNRAYKTVLDYVTGDVKDPTPIYSAAGYFRLVLAEETPHVHIAERGRQEAAALADPVATTDGLAGSVDAFLAKAAADTPMHLFVGEMQLDQYLATRVVELVVHGLDLSAAIDLPTNPPTHAMRVAITVLLELAGDDDLASVARLLTGRAASLPLTNVLD